MTGSSSLRLIDLVRVDAQCIMHLLRKRDVFPRDLVLTNVVRGSSAHLQPGGQESKNSNSTNDFILRKAYEWRLGKNASGGKLSTLSEF